MQPVTNFFSYIFLFVVFFFVVAIIWIQKYLERRAAELRREAAELERRAAEVETMRQELENQAQRYVLYGAYCEKRAAGLTDSQIALTWNYTKSWLSKQKKYWEENFFFERYGDDFSKSEQNGG